MNVVVPEIEGADVIVNWFGRWPSFHDAEIRELHLDWKGRSWIKLYTLLMTKDINESSGFLKKRAFVIFEFERVVNLELNGFYPQNVISHLDLEKSARGLRLFYGADHRHGGIHRGEENGREARSD